MRVGVGGEAGWKEHPKNHRPKIQTARNFEKDLNEFILSRKRENQTETLGGGMWRIQRFGDKSLKPDIRTTDRNPLANNWNESKAWMRKCFLSPSVLKFRWFSALGSVCRFSPTGFASEIRHDKNRADEAVRPIARA